jgi:hypothetical protein
LPGAGLPTAKVDDGSDQSGDHDHEHHTRLVPALNMESSGTLTTSTIVQTHRAKGSEPEDEQDGEGG